MLLGQLSTKVGFAMMTAITIDMLVASFSSKISPDQSNVSQEHCWEPYLPGIVLLLEAALRGTAQQDVFSCGAARCLLTIGRFGLPWELIAALRASNSTSRNSLTGKAVRDAWPASALKAFLQLTAQAVAQQQEGDNAQNALLTALAQLQPPEIEKGQTQVQSVLQSLRWVPPPLPASSEAMFSLCCSSLKCLDAAAARKEQLALPPSPASATITKGLNRLVGSADEFINFDVHQQPCFGCMLPQLTAMIGTALSDGCDSCPDTAASSSSSSSSSAMLGIERLAKCLKWQLLSARACYTAGAWLQQHASRMQDSSNQQQQQQGQAWLDESEVLSSRSCLAAWTCMAVQQLSQLQAQAAAAEAESGQATSAGMLPHCVASALRLLPLQSSTSRGELAIEELCRATLEAVRQADGDADTCMAAHLHAWYTEKQQLSAHLEEAMSNASKAGWNKLTGQWVIAACSASETQNNQRLKIICSAGTLLLEVTAACQALLDNLEQAQKMLQQPLPGELYR
jgi:hypothetical protein